MSQVDWESSLDVKCGLVDDISQGETVDKLFDVKLALTSFDTRRKGGTDVLTNRPP